MKGIILLEGSDASGKTTLARHLVDRYGARYLHSTVRRSIWKWHVGALRYAARLADERLVVMDRLWHSEQIYGPIFRGRPGYDAAGARVLDRLLLKHGAVTVLCVPSDLKEHEARWARDRAAGKKEHFASVRDVIAAYYDLAHGNVARAGNEYTDQLTRYNGGMLGRSDVLIYNLDHNWPKLYAPRLLNYLEYWRSLQLLGSLEYRRQNLAGSIAKATIVFVGDRVSPSHDYRFPFWPFACPNFTDGSTGYLNQTLHDLNFDETRAIWTNANEPRDDHLDAILSRRKLRIIALGQAAARTCHQRGRAPDAIVPHPAWWRRFHHHEREEYARQLGEALR